jgi:Flp pilus assembly protein CpaB
MKPKTLILMVVAVVCGLGASYMTSRLLAERDDKPAEAPPLEKVKLLVTKNNMTMHTPLRAKPEEFFTEKEFVKDDAPKDAITMADVAKLKGKFLSRGLHKGDVVTPEDLTDFFGLKKLPDGMRAVGIRVSPDQVAGGFSCVPGSHVDILWTRRGGNDKDTFTKVLLKDVVVLAADVNVERAENGSAMPANVVTVALDYDQALRISLAIDTGGSLRLILRNLDDHDKQTDVETLTAEQLIRGNMTPKKEEPVLVAELPPLDHTRPDTLSGRGTPALPNKVAPEALGVPLADVPEAPPVPRPKPLPNLKKMTVTVRNNADLQVRHYWVDENNNIIHNPQQYLEEWQQNGGPPSPGNKEQGSAGHEGPRIPRQQD